MNKFIKENLEIMARLSLEGNFNGSELTDEMIDEQFEKVISIFPGANVLNESEIDEIKRKIKSSLSIKLDKGIVIENIENRHENWYLSKKAEIDAKYWNRYRQYLISNKKFTNRVVNTMDDILDKITDLLGDPTRDVSYARRGLIIGDVQSGKTANYIGLMCKAADVGYKVIVLLTGTTENLRQQTQKRVDEGFVGQKSAAMINKESGSSTYVGVGEIDPSIFPTVFTSTKEDFKSNNAMLLDNISGSVVFVVKKNYTVLDKLNTWLKTYNQKSNNAINESILLIDDEADNASINTNNEDEDPTRINAEIRKLLSKFRKSSYVALTATPFANIFIDPDTVDDMYKEDLFPKDYIYSLNAPSNYIGARDIFSEDGKYKTMLNEINNDYSDKNSIAYILPTNHKSSKKVNVLPEDLKTAINTFLIANVLEDLKGLKNNHRSMLVNVSKYTNVQDDIAALIVDYLKEIQESCRVFSKLDTIKALEDKNIKKLKETYEEIYKNKESDNNLPIINVEWSDIQNNLYTSCASVVVNTVNQKSTEKIDYDAYKKDGYRVIAVGGMSLSRGLTLEGLVVSYFYRNSKAYDTIMQMGRWFGYREDYKEFCRIWMSEESIEWYRYISEVTDELREEVKRYQSSSLTPQDFGLRVRSDKTSLIVTAYNKMKTAEKKECVISLSGEYIETPEIYSDLDKNKKNLSIINQLVIDLDEDGYKNNKISENILYKDINKGKIINLLNNIDVSPKNQRFDTKVIKEFIENYKGDELDKWDIAFVSKKSTNEVEDITIGTNIKYTPLTRSYSIENNGKILKMSGSKKRLGSSNNGRIGISEDEIEEVFIKSGKKEKASLAQKDYFKYIKRNPLLTIYIVNPGKFIGEKTEINLQVKRMCENHNFVGFGIGIPTLKNQESKYAKYMLNKVALKNLYEDEMAGEEDE